MKRPYFFTNCCGASVNHAAWRRVFGASWVICDCCKRPAKFIIHELEGPEPPKPTKKPEFAWYTWLWWAYGWCVFRPYKAVARKVFYRNGNRTWIRRQLQKWFESGKKAIAFQPFKYFIYKWVDWAFSGYYCPHCNYSGFNDSCNDDFFECTDSGSYGTQDGTVYWFEGWTWCPRCRHREFTSDST